MVLARHVLCAVGRWTGFDPLEVVVSAYGGASFALDRAGSRLTSDPLMKGAFATAADRVEPTLGAQELQEVEQHTSVARVLGPPLVPETAVATSVRVLALIGALLDAGALGVRVESSGLTHSRAHWRALASQALSEDHRARSTALYKAFVRRPVRDGDLLLTCGLHLLGQRDVEVHRSEDVHEDLRWLDLMGIYQVGERPDGGIRPGETLGSEADGERRVLQEQPCLRYAPDSLKHNPQGYWRLERVPGSAPVPPRRRRRWLSASRERR